MNNIASSDTVSAPPVEEPSERNPVELMWKAQHKFNWTIYDFATCFGWDSGTIQKWMYGRKPSKQARIMAAILWKQWDLE